MDTRGLGLRWEMDHHDVSLTFITDSGESRFSAKAALLSGLPLLPVAIAADEPVETVAGAYQSLLRSLQASGGAHGPNAMERLFSHFGDQNTGTVNIKLTAADGPAAELLGLPWELLLHDNNRDYLRERLARVALVRSLGITSEYSPREIDSKFRVLLLHGASGDPPLDFEGERKALQDAWAALGMLLNVRIAEPKICAAEVDRLAMHLVTEKPHLLWFSGHGRQSADDFELLFAGGPGDEWRSVSVLSNAVAEAARATAQVPLMAAFWACEGARSGTLKRNPSFDSASSKFPILVSKMLSTGVEAVLGVQTQIYDSSARTMGESFFRAVAEGSGPAIALGAARAELHRHPSRWAPGSGSEWTSPVLWINGADMPDIKWASSIGPNEAVVFHRLGRESMLAVEGGPDIFAERPPAPLSGVAHNWSESAPIWLICSDLNHLERKLGIIRDLRQILLTENKTVLLIHHETLHDSGVLDAVTRAFRSLKRRIFPTYNAGEIDFLVSLFEAFAGDKRKDGWLRLLRRPELVIAILADGGMDIDENLAAASSAAAKVIVISNKNATDPDGMAPSLTGWKADDLCTEASPFRGHESTSDLLGALAILDKPLAEDAINLLGHDFGLDDVHKTVLPYMARFGDRYVVKASIAHALFEQMADDERRAAHRACMNFLERAPRVLDADCPTQLTWRSAHAMEAGETQTALNLAAKAISSLVGQGSFGQAAELYGTLKSIRGDLRPETKVQVALAQIRTGYAQRGHDIIRQIPLESIRNQSERLRFYVVKADALRNLSDRTMHQKSIEVLEQALRESEGKITSLSEDRRSWLTAKHDLGRNLHYFRRDAAGAREIFLEVVEQCGNDSTFSYTKAAALRNLSDIHGKYGYGKVKSDPQLAYAYLRQATDVAKGNSAAMPLLPEFLYLLAKVDYADGRIGDAGANIQEAIRRARERGGGLILVLSTNKQFWWQCGPLTAENARQSFDYSNWQRIEEQLDLTSQHPWVARALVTSRVRAAKCLDLQSKRIAATEVLQRARALLEKSSLFAGEADFRKRWQPVYAGLSVLNAPSSAAGDQELIRGHDEGIWNELKGIGAQIFTTADFPLAEPKQLWEGVT